MAQSSMQKPADRRRRPRRAAVARAAAALLCLAATAFASAAQAGRADAGPSRSAAGPPPASADSLLRIVFLDVGQGDAVLITAPEGGAALVDAGPGDVVPLLRALGVTRLNLVVATHPHADHIGGLAEVIDSLTVGAYMDNGQPHATRTYRQLMSRIDARPEITYLEAVPRMLTLGGMSIEVLPPLPPEEEVGVNDRSVALVVRFGAFAAFLNGDSEERQLSHLVEQEAVPDVDLLKAPHHGSDNGFTEEFLKTAAPEVVVISVGDNTYGHPRQEAVDAYEAAGAQVLRTDRHGRIEVLARRDGSYTLHVEKGAGGRTAGAGSGGRMAGAGRGGGRLW